VSFLSSNRFVPYLNQITEFVSFHSLVNDFVVFHFPYGKELAASNFPSFFFVNLVGTYIDEIILSFPILVNKFVVHCFFLAVSPFEISFDLILMKL